MVVTSSFCTSLPFWYKHADIIPNTKDIKHINLNAIFKYQTQKILFCIKKLIVYGNNIPEKPTIRKSVLLYSFIWHDIYGTGRILKLSTLPPNNSTARECPLSCKNGYIISTETIPKTNKEKNLNASFTLSPTLIFAIY